MGQRCCPLTNVKVGAVTVTGQFDGIYARRRFARVLADRFRGDQQAFAKHIARKTLQIFRCIAAE
jgi:hypothetical protein